MDKKHISKLIPIADKVLSESQMLSKEKTIESSYNGLVAAFPVSVAMSGLKPTIIIYAQDKDSGRSVVLKVLLKMMKEDGASFPSDVEMLIALIRSRDCNQAVEDALKKELIDCAVALKLVVRTYSFKES